MSWFTVEYMRRFPNDPMADMSGYDYLTQQDVSPAERRHRMLLVYAQSFATILLGWMFARLAWYAIMATYRHPRHVVTWCVLIQATAGVALCLGMNTAYLLPVGVTCRVILDFASTCVGVSMMCVHVTLLLKAYAAYSRDLRLLLAGILLMLPAPIFVVLVLVSSPATINTTSGCYVHYPAYFPWLKFGLETPVNVLLSVAFLRVVVREYRIRGTDCWYNLSREGMIVMIATVSATLLFTLIAASEVLGGFSDMLWMLDWFTSCALLAHHIDSLQYSFRPSGHRRFRRLPLR